MPRAALEPDGAARPAERRHATISNAFSIRAGEAGARFRQEFPPDCVPIRAGKIVLPIEPYVSSIEESVDTMKIASFKAGPTQATAS